jgi:hypothetical protein
MAQPRLEQPSGHSSFTPSVLRCSLRPRSAPRRGRTRARANASAGHAQAPADEVPALAAVADELTAALGGDQAFEFGIAALLDGIELRARR